ncbi:dTDP-4-dehydrorhamnose 3,5-epimerase [Sphingomonas lutea]|uniref:dTDP-4-dehydrorhamnose 3,5-epimerase n=1 Tax=Sphingomonas lutea TaxID=1045317 RepID=A0A7G9SEV1_9SPHN|nr:dTDP-4-dehydrorhamnose 3,5-epimerase [Sphingomonas lutea]QNN66376.1 dTDP-4-dehydrorhamnose 3,5-epimerase [Sphingomonas lutea]
MLEVRPLGLEGVLEIIPRKHADERGFFSEVWREDALKDAGVDVTFVQDNHSFSKTRGVVRGLHFQLPPFAQDKLVRVTRGAIFDVAVDIRRDSSTYGRWVGLTVSAAQWNQIFIPRGFAHGFLTIEDGTEVVYKVSAPYSPQHDRGLRFDDPAIGVDWPLDGEPLLSSKDTAAPLLADLETGS